MEKYIIIRLPVNSDKTGRPRIPLYTITTKSKIDKITTKILNSNIKMYKPIAAFVSLCKEFGAMGFREAVINVKRLNNKLQ